jgi:GT2 family glycosyltransferase
MASINSRPKVSVIIINFNTKQLTVQCIDSVIEKTKGVSFEIILVDNASTECNPTVFKELFPSITLVQSATNSGFAKGNNQGIAVSNGEYILLLNSDTQLLNDAISLSVNALEARLDVGVLTCRLLYPDGRTQINAAPLPKISTAFYDIVRAQKFISAEKTLRIYQSYFVNYDKEFEPEWIWGTFFLIKRSTIDLFPNKKLHDDFFMYGEDIQWCWYITKALGYKALYSPLGKITHFIGGRNKQKTNELDGYFIKMITNQYIFLCWSRGQWYAKTYYLLNMFYRLSKPRKSSWEIAARYWAFIKEVTSLPIPIEEFGGNAH